MDLQFFGGRGSSSSAGAGGMAKIRSFERSAYKQDTESSMIVTANGEVIQRSGDEKYVFGSRADVEKMNGGIASHNHPNNSTFSDTDVVNGIAKGNLKEMRIVTKSGEVHSIKNKGATVDQRRAFSAQYRNQMMKATNNIHTKQRRGEKVDSEKYLKQHMESWMEKNAKSYNLSFSKGKVK